MMGDDIDILRYINHDMSSDEHIAFEKSIQQNRELEERVKVMQLSTLPYHKAMSLHDTPMPASINEFFDQQCLLLNEKNHQKKNAFTFNRIMVSIFSVCFFIAGFISHNYIGNTKTDVQNLHTASINATDGKNSLLSSYTLLSSYSVPAELFTSMITYQMLYTRNTLSSNPQTMGHAKKVIQAFNEQHNTQIKIPNLAKQGYQFKRVQELAYKDHSILQLVYLPPKGDPIAICITTGTKNPKTPTDTSDKPIVDYGGLNTLIWHQTNNIYMLMGKLSEDQLMPIAKATIL